MTGAWEELRTTGEVGPLTAVLVYETVDAVRRFDRYPPPEGAEDWDAAAVHDVAHDFLVAPRATERLRRLVVNATDQESFERVLERAVRNHLRMQARRTDTGAVLRALQHVVHLDDAVVSHGSASSTTWALTLHADNDLYSGEVRPLVAAAYAVPDVRQARWASTSTRRAPIAEPESLRRVVHAVLDATAAPVPSMLVVDVIVERFPLCIDSTTAEVHDLIVATETGPESAAIAEDVWAQLSDNERLVTGVLDLPVREMAEATGLSKSTAQRAATSARVVLAACLVDADDPTGVVSAIASASAELRMRGTNRAGSASAKAQED